MDPTCQRHVVHFYEAPDARDRAVVEWVLPTLRNGGGALLVCTPSNAARVRAGLCDAGLDVEDLERHGRLMIVRARDLMARFIDARGLHPETFRHLARDLILKIRVGCGDSDAPIRVWGEMVHLLWEAGDRSGAHRLEQMWNDILPEAGVELLCSYDVAGATDAAYDALRRDVMETHVHAKVLA